ncbi:MAG: phosphate ABC transporter permease subunit PstC [Phycisphaerae bacterium]|nr:phosphate ABC transporter permease subunit PstC [Phycisphaerae bacterium]
MSDASIPISAFPIRPLAGGGTGGSRGGASPGTPGTPLLTRKAGMFGADRILFGLCFGSCLVVVGMLLSLVVVLTVGALPSIKHFGPKFLTQSEWRSAEIAARTPDGKIVYDADGETAMNPPTYGAAAVIYGTCVTSAIALLLAVPPSLAAAIFLIRIAPRWLADPTSFLIEFLAAIPSLAYGLWGMFVLVPFLRDHVEPLMLKLFGDWPGLSRLFHDAAGRPVVMTGSDLLAGGVILAIMILPIITAISRDVLRAVPRAQIEGSIALGATWWQSAKEMLKFSRGGLFGAIMLGLARAAGETMAVAMVIGINTQIRISPFAPAQTMSSLLAVTFGEANDDVEKASLVQVALILLVMSLIFNVVARYLVVGKAVRPATAA